MATSSSRCDYLITRVESRLATFEGLAKAVF